MASETMECPDCETTIETRDDVEKADTVHTLEFEEDEAKSGPPRVRIGVDQRDLYRCAQCGKILGVN
jgi:uncharacterized Zn finger protein